MARALEGAVASLLQGVSQQVARERLAGQVSAQVNMISDPVTGVRRRPPTVNRNFGPYGPVVGDSLFSQFLERGADGRHLLINTDNGGWWLFNNTGSSVMASGSLSYFLAASRRSIQTTSLGGKTYICNTEKRPSGRIDNTGLVDPKHAGFFFVRSGAFSKRYNVSVFWDGGRAEAEYTTPDGTTAGDAAKSVPEWIAEQLAEALRTAGVTWVTRDGPNCYLQNNTLANIRVVSESGSSYMGWSNQSEVTLETDLPSRLPPAAGGYLCSVGNSDLSTVWYRYDATRGVWLEAGAYGSVTDIPYDTPMVLDGDVMTQFVFEGRLAGDDNTNEAPSWLRDRRITGIGTYQGRLVLLSGAYVCMSAAGKPARFFRSTVSSLAEIDRIDISSGSAQNSTFRQAVQFNKDLVLFGDSTQAVVPATQQALSPLNASIVLTSDLTCQADVAPASTAQTLLYAAPRSQSFSAVLELVPSQYTSSQYISQDVTTHIPRYIAGRLRFLASATAANMVALAPAGDEHSLVVHEYHFSNEGKVQAAWHMWTFPFRVGSVHFARDLLYVYGAQTGSGGNVGMLALDPKQGGVNFDGNVLAYLDNLHTVNVVNNSGTVPAALRPWFTGPDSILGAYITGDKAGEGIAVTVNPLDWSFTVPVGAVSGQMYLGLRYTSLLAPTPPLLRDQNEVVVGTAPVRLLRYELTAQHSGEFDVRVQDTARGADRSGVYTALLMNSLDLSPDRAMRWGVGRIIIPCRTNAASTELTLSSNGTQEMNILDIEYILKHNQRRRRL